MNSFKEGWFSELSPLWDGQCISLEVEEVLHTEKSKYQDIAVLKTYIKSNVECYFRINSRSNVVGNPMGMFLSWMELFNVLKEMSSPIKK